MKGLGDNVDKLVNEKFTSQGYTVIDRKPDSPNARHFVVQKGQVTKHVKVVKKTYITSHSYSEIDILKSIQSDHVIKLEEHGDIDKDNVYMVFPHINGSTLDKLAKDGGWEEELLITLIKHVVHGLRDITAAGIVHQDIKPKNIIYDNVNKKYVILDLGMGFFIGDNIKSKIPKGEGPMFYTAPEQFKIALLEPYSLFQTIDQFSFGAVLYQLATNRHPYITVDKEKSQNYASLLYDPSLPKKLVRGGSLSDKLCDAIEKMLSTEPSRRYLTLDSLERSLDIRSASEAGSKPKFYLKIHHKAKPEFTHLVTELESDIDGVILSTSDDQKYADAFFKLGVPILIDPNTYKLQNNKNTSGVVSKLGLPEVEIQYNCAGLRKLKENLLFGAHNYATDMHSSKIILPYFNIEGASKDYLEFTKELWSDAYEFYTNKGLATDHLYGALIIPYSVITNENERSKLMSQLIGMYPLEGVVAIFENKNISVLTAVEKLYLEGVKDFITFFESVFNDVIVYQTDISALPFINKSSYSIGWQKKSRHFNNVVMSSKKGQKREYKIKYYAPKLFGIVEDRADIQTIVSIGKKKYLDCTCPECIKSKPLETTYKGNELMERQHFYRHMAHLHSHFMSLTPSAKSVAFKSYLTKCDNNVLDLIKTSPAIIIGKTVPRYETLIALIDD